MAYITYPTTLTNGNPADAGEVMDMFDAITEQTNGGLDAVNLNDNAADTRVILNQAVTTAKLDDDAVTAAKLATDAVVDDSIDYTDVKLWGQQDNAGANGVW